jgi:heterotetrameric sarcosine oxidase gamma subunit
MSDASNAPPTTAERIAGTTPETAVARPVVGRLVPGEAAGAEDPSLTLSELSAGALLEVGAWPNRLETVANRLGELAGVTLPGRPGRFTESASALVCWIAFGRFIYVGAAAEDTARVDTALDTEDAAVVDLAGARRIVRIEGGAAPALLNKAVAIDFDPAAFPAGALAQSVIHQIPVVILRRSEMAFDVLAPSSLADALIDWITDAALEFGYRVGEPGTIL